MFVVATRGRLVLPPGGASGISSVTQSFVTALYHDHPLIVHYYDWLAASVSHHWTTGISHITGVTTINPCQVPAQSFYPPSVGPLWRLTDHCANYWHCESILSLYYHQCVNFKHLFISMWKPDLSIMFIILNEFISRVWGFPNPTQLF